jgi:hypothetical protein
MTSSVSARLTTCGDVSAALTFMSRLRGRDIRLKPLT